METEKWIEIYKATYQEVVAGLVQMENQMKMTQEEAQKIIKQLLKPEGTGSPQCPAILRPTSTMRRSRRRWVSVEREKQESPIPAR